MRAFLIVLGILYLLFAVAGCAAVVDRVNSFPERHPCGNVWDVCPHSTPFWGRINAVLEARG